MNENATMAKANSQSGAWADRLDVLYTPVIADVLDKLGYREQTFRPEIRPLFPGAGQPALRERFARSPAAELAPPEPYKGEMAAVDAPGLAT